MPGAELKAMWCEVMEELAPHLQQVKHFWREKRKEITSRKRQVIGYGNRLKNAAAQTILLIAVFAVLTAGILYMMGTLWEIYGATPMGQQFIEFFPDRAWDAYDLFDRNPIDFAIKITIQAFLICTIFGAVSRVTGLTRLLYLPFGKGLRVLLWGLPLTVITASNIQYMHDMDTFGSALVIALLPTVGVFSNCFQLTSNLLPEGSELIRLAAALIKRQTR